MPLQRRNQMWQSLEEGVGKRCSEYGGEGDPLSRWEEETGVKEVWSLTSVEGGEDR